MNLGEPLDLKKIYI